MMFELGNRVGETWRLRHELEKQVEKQPGIPKCDYDASGEPGPRPGCERPVEYCEMQPVSTDTYELRLYSLCRLHAQLKDAEEEWGDSICDLLEWEQVLEESRELETKEEVVALLERKCDVLRVLCDQFAAYVDSVKYTGKGEHPLA
jgi:hypothetical protein